MFEFESPLPRARVCGKTGVVIKPRPFRFKYDPAEAYYLYRLAETFISRDHLARAVVQLVTAHHVNLRALFGTTPLLDYNTNI